MRQRIDELMTAHKARRFKVRPLGMPQQPLATVEKHGRTIEFYETCYGVVRRENEDNMPPAYWLLQSTEGTE
ncbi:MAG: hypothetical protein ACF8OB_05010 [Phycisphaeraceae bacterium JB051]